MDRMFGLNKFYGNVPPSVEPLGRRGTLNGKTKTIALDEVVRRYCHHCGIDYAGMLAVQGGEGNDKTPFQTDEVIGRAKSLANKILKEIERGVL